MDERTRSIEVSARSVEDAVAKAVQQLGVSQDDVQVEIVRQGSRGLLGLLGEEAVVRVTIGPRPTPIAVPEEHETEEEIAAGEEVAVPVADQTEVAQVGAQVLQTLLDHMGLQARVEIEDIPSRQADDPESVLLNISGSDLAVLIGRQGEMLRDLQFITGLMVSRQLQRWPSIVVDVEHYKSRRQKSLEDLARRMADTVRASGEPVSLEPMPPHERRIVHLALRDDADVYTESAGQDDKRKVFILPKE